MNPPPLHTLDPCTSLCTISVPMNKLQAHSSHLLSLKSSPLRKWVTGPPFLRAWTQINKSRMMSYCPHLVS